MYELERMRRQQQWGIIAIGVLAFVVAVLALTLVTPDSALGRWIGMKAKPPQATPQPLPDVPHKTIQDK